MLIPNRMVYMLMNGSKKGLDLLCRFPDKKGKVFTELYDDISQTEKVFKELQVNATFLKCCIS